jgi:hypothetical protein
MLIWSCFQKNSFWSLTLWFEVKTAVVLTVGVSEAQYLHITIREISPVGDGMLATQIHIKGTTGGVSFLKVREVLREVRDLNEPSSKQ